MTHHPHNLHSWSELYREETLVESRATASGVTIQVYRTAGRPRYG